MVAKYTIKSRTKYETVKKVINYDNGETSIYLDSGKTIHTSDNFAKLEGKSGNYISLVNNLELI